MVTLERQLSGRAEEAATEHLQMAPRDHRHRQRDVLCAWGQVIPRCLGLLLALAIVLASGGTAQDAALAWSLPGQGRTHANDAASKRSPAIVPSTAGLQEVAPPAGVQQLSEALADHQPRLSILEPADGALLPAGPWHLRLQADDWPLVDAGALGLGPHLLVQLDDQMPQPLVETSLTMPALSPGSHRLTVMAARPWGEVVKRPGAFAQIRIHRVSANPLSLPGVGTPQLLPTSPLEASSVEPVLLDWLLIDAPLQHLRVDDARWRLRVSVNGDSFLVDEATPLWLRGWKRGANALLLELVDGRGEPLNPPFNSVVRELTLGSGESRPAWMNGRLSDGDLARLLGQAPPVTAVDAEPQSDGDGTSAEAVSMPSPQPTATASPADAANIEAAGLASGAAISPPDDDPLSSAAPSEPAAAAGGSEIPVPLPLLPPEEDPPSPTPGSMEGPASTPAADLQAKTLPAKDSVQQESTTAQESPDAGTPEPPAAMETAPQPPPVPLSRPAARDEVNADGTLIRPSRPSPLQALRERLQR
ncbi:MAG: hypothetical protein ACK5Q7_11105 [Cyanobacteriota bacterium]